MALSSDNSAQTNITNYYPTDILSENNQFRSVMLLVKNQESLNGGVESLVENVTKKAAKLGELIDTLGDTRVNPADAQSMKKIVDRASKLASDNIKTIYGIALPLPNELSDSQSHQWETTEGAVGSIVGGMVNNASVGGLSVNKALGELTSVAGFRKPLIDPGYFQDYKGTEPREFRFSWDLIPSNADEVDQIMLLVYNLKKYTLPKASINGISLVSPYLFDIQIGNPRINALMNMNNVICKSMTVSYAAEGSLQFLPDGMPKYIRLEMTFAERALMTSDLY